MVRTLDLEWVIIGINLTNQPRCIFYLQSSLMSLDNVNGCYSFFCIFVVCCCMKVFSTTFTFPTYLAYS